MSILEGQGNRIDSNNRECAILGGFNNLINHDCESCCILGGDNNEIDNSHNKSIVLMSVSNHTFLVKCSNRATFFTNTANTAGVTVGSRGGSWASVSDVNKKENLVELDCQNIMKKMEELPVYQYNYIGNPKEQRCFGPTAQDWYKSFPTEKDQLTIKTMDMISVLMATVKNLE